MISTTFAQEMANAFYQMKTTMIQQHGTLLSRFTKVLLT